jgi:hypothetical protein
MAFHGLSRRAEIFYHLDFGHSNLFRAPARLPRARSDFEFGCGFVALCIYLTHPIEAALPRGVSFFIGIEIFQPVRLDVTH